MVLSGVLVCVLVLSEASSDGYGKMV